ncbi:hypothetical protein SLA2020_370580 [Shorea laevis]
MPPIKNLERVTLTTLRGRGRNLTNRAGDLGEGLLLGSSGLRITLSRLALLLASPCTLGATFWTGFFGIHLCCPVLHRHKKHDQRHYRMNIFEAARGIQPQCQPYPHPPGQ